VTSLSPTCQWDRLLLRGYSLEGAVIVIVCFFLAWLGLACAYQVFFILKCLRGKGKFRCGFILCGLLSGWRAGWLKGAMTRADVDDDDGDGSRIVAIRYSSTVETQIS